MLKHETGHLIRRSPQHWQTRRRDCANFAFLRDRKVTTKKLCDKDFAALWVNSLVQFASKLFFYWVLPSNCSENSLVWFTRFFGFVGPFLGKFSFFLLPPSHPSCFSNMFPPNPRSSSGLKTTLAGAGREQGISSYKSRQFWSELDVHDLTLKTERFSKRQFLIRSLWPEKIICIKIPNHWL